MIKKTKFYKKLVAVVICVAILASNLNINIGSQGISVFKNSLASAEELEVNTPDNIRGGTILQAFCWSFNTIKANMASIAAAGYTAVQTSPIQACLDTNPTMELGGNGHWYYHYQPTDFTIGNYQLGTEEEFIAMCEEADAYGVKVIVDVVPNHTTPTQAEISQNLIDAAGYRQVISCWNRFD